jgi:hypothetical protein
MLEPLQSILKELTVDVVKGRPENDVHAMELAMRYNYIDLYLCVVFLIGNEKVFVVKVD